ncbi:MAG TPA: hypothetical protein VED59_01030 [Acidimicrobiales bacterium]|nr:hypothetical protein [Acidimicrobiales bacterium]
MQLKRLGVAGQVAVQRLGTAGTIAALAGILLFVILVGIAVPALAHHSNGHPSVTPTTSPGQTTPTTSPVPTSSPTPPTSTAPPTTSGGSAGQTVSNKAVSVTLPGGWTEDTKDSNSTQLVVDGPQGVFVELLNQTEPSSQTLAGVFEQALSTTQQTFPDAKVCNQQQSGTVPGNPAVSGAFESFCFTITPQNGAATPYVGLVYAGLVQGSGFQLLVEADFIFPQSMDNTTFNQVIGALVHSIQWRQISASSGPGS